MPPSTNRVTGLGLLLLVTHSDCVWAQRKAPVELKPSTARTFPATVARHRLEQPKREAPAVSPEEEAKRKIPKILGGLDAIKGQFPWQVALIRAAAPSDDPFGGHFCGGTLIGWRWVLTAAHCTYENSSDGPAPIEAQAIDVYVGSHDFTGGQRLKVKRIIRHSGYNLDTQDNDISLLEIADEPDPKTGLELVTLIGKDDDQPVQPRMFATVVGWGSTESGVLPAGVRKSVQVLQYIEDLTFHPSNNCNKEHLKYQRGWSRTHLQQQGRTQHEVVELLSKWYPSGATIVTQNMVCAGTNNGSKDSCFGDSGGPLLVQRGRRNVQVGIVSWGPPEACGLTALHGVYVRLSRYRGWIEKHKD